LADVALTIGIVGLPNAGKSTLFNALTRNDVLAANYPFATIEPNVGVVGVPDPRLAVLSDLFSSERIVPATVSFVDIAGIVRGASQGEGMGNAFLSHIREADAICQVTRVFSDPDVTHVDGAVNPPGDIETISTELILADLQTVERALPRLEKEARMNKDRAVTLVAVREAYEVLSSGRGVFAAGLDRQPSPSSSSSTATPTSWPTRRCWTGCAPRSPRPKPSSWTPRSSPSWSRWSPTRPGSSWPRWTSPSPAWTCWPGWASTPWACRPT
jgi:GTP-binding protein YchF